MSDFQLVQTVLDQSHLSPLAKSVQPVHSEFDHALRLYPLPTAVCHLACFVDASDLLGDRLCSRTSMNNSR